MRNENERKSSSSSPATLDCDVGLGLKMPLQPSDNEPFFSNTSNFECAADTLVFSRSNFQNPVFRTFGGGTAVCGKALFTASQWQELERQKMIHKYIMASIPVPPQLLLPNSTTPARHSISQSNSLDLRYSSTGSDPEPWRCKRTDGKKWRCSRDVAPDQRYCERHAHKTRTRSRKQVEISSSSHNSYSQSTTINNTLHPLQRSSSQSIPTMASATSYGQNSRCSIEWLMRDGDCSSSSSSMPISACNQQQWQQLMQQLSSSSSRLVSNRDDNRDHNKNVSSYQPKSFMSLNPYNIPDTIKLDNHNASILDSKTGSSSQTPTTTTRCFIDAWEKEGLSGSSSLSNKLSPISSSLTLSMSSGEDHHNEINGMIHSDRDSEYGTLRGVSWMNSSPPGGPLGEALCLGNNAATTSIRGGSYMASPHGYSNSNANSSKSSCEEGSHALDFIG